MARKASKKAHHKKKKKAMHGAVPIPGSPAQLPSGALGTGY